MVHRQLADVSLLPGELAQFTLLREIDALQKEKLSFKSSILYVEEVVTHFML